MKTGENMERKAGREFHKLLDFFEKSHKKFAELESQAKSETINPVRREIAECQKLEIIYGFRARVMEFSERYEFNPIMDIN